jgi:hypothetical protein
MSGRLRLFVALELPAPAVDALVVFRDAAGDPDVWRPLPPDSLHVTLAFMGPRDPATVGPASEVLRAAAGPVPRLALAGALLLPPRRARVLCAALADPDGGLARLVRAGVERSRAWYDQGDRLTPLLDRRSAACTTAMAGIYRELGEQIAARPQLVYTQRLSLSGRQKATVAVRSLIGRTS